MKTAVTDTSKEAYYATEKKRGTQQARVLRRLRMSGSFGSCIADLAYDLAVRTSSVSARLNELKNDKDIELELVDIRPSLTTKIKSEHWRVKNKETLF